MFSPRTHVESFITLASKITILSINPVARLTPLAQRGGGNLFLPIWQKSLIFNPRIHVETRTCVEGFITLALKFTNLKINPIALLTPLTPKGEGINFCLFSKCVLYLVQEHMFKVS